MGTISKKANALMETLRTHGLLEKKAEKIEHIASPENQGSFGRKQQKEIQQGSQGDYESAKGASAIPEMKEPELIEGDHKTPAKSDMKSTGTTIDRIDPQGNAQGTPQQVYNKVASLRRRLNACVGAEMNKQAAYMEATKQQFVSATEVMHKVAALAQLPDGPEADALAADIDIDFNHRLHNNPLFGPACEQVAFRKMAAEIEELADAEGIPEETAADALDASMASDPAAQEEFNNEVEGEAVSDLSDAEGETEDMLAGLDDTAAQVSAVTGENVTAEDLVQAVDEVVQQAEELGVEPEALIQAAADEMAAGADGGEGVPADEAQMAEQLVEAAAQEGISPEELIQGLAAMDEEGAAEAPAEEMPKEASFYKQAALENLATTRRGANLARILAAAGR